MAEGIVFSSKRDSKDVTKANPRLLEDYEVQFPEDYAQFKGSVTVKFKHITADIISRCFATDADGNRMLSDFRIFEKCVKQVNGLSKYVTNADGIEETVPLSVNDIVQFEDLRAEADGGVNAMSIIFIVVHDVAQAILAKSTLTEEEEKNLYADVKP